MSPKSAVLIFVGTLLLSENYLFRITQPLYNSDFSIVQIEKNGLAALASPCLQATDQLLCVNDFPVVGWVTTSMKEELEAAKNSGRSTIKLTIKRFTYETDTKYITENERLIPEYQIPNKTTNLTRKETLLEKVQNQDQTRNFMRRRTGPRKANFNKKRANHCKSIGDLDNLKLDVPIRVRNKSENQLFP